MAKGFCTLLQKKIKRAIKELQTNHPHLGPWKNHGANPLGAHFQAKNGVVMATDDMDLPGANLA